jgi:hypothetical protein
MCLASLIFHIHLSSSHYKRPSRFHLQIPYTPPFQALKPHHAAACRTVTSSATSRTAPHRQIQPTHQGTSAPTISGKSRAIRRKVRIDIYDGGRHGVMGVVECEDCFSFISSLNVNCIHHHHITCTSTSICCGRRYPYGSPIRSELVEVCAIDTVLAYSLERLNPAIAATAVWSAERRISTTIRL